MLANMNRRRLMISVLASKFVTDSLPSARLRHVCLGCRRSLRRRHRLRVRLYRAISIAIAVVVVPGDLVSFFTRLLPPRLRGIHTTV